MIKNNYLKTIGFIFMIGFLIFFHFVRLASYVGLVYYFFLICFFFLFFYTALSCRLSYKSLKVLIFLVMIWAFTGSVVLAEEEDSEKPVKEDLVKTFHLDKQRSSDLEQIFNISLVTIAALLLLYYWVGGGDISALLSNRDVAGEAADAAERQRTLNLLGRLVREAARRGIGPPVI